VKRGCLGAAAVVVLVVCLVGAMLFVSLGGVAKLNAAAASCLPTPPDSTLPPAAGAPATSSQGPPALDAVPADLRAKWSLPQLQHAATIIGVAKTLKVPPRGMLIALAVAIGESNLRNAASEAEPASKNFPHDIVYPGDHRSVGLFQAQIGVGWGSLAQLMDPVHQARGFLGGPQKPIDTDRNQPTNRGLLDVPDWETMTVTQAGHAVQGNADPHYYAQFEAPATALLAGAVCVPQQAANGAVVGEWALPLPPPLPYNPDFGCRDHPVYGPPKWHDGEDWPAPEGTPVFAAGAGEVTFTGEMSGYGNTIDLRHPDGTSTRYAHLSRIGVTRGGTVMVGQQIGAVGHTGVGTGDHLHFEVAVGGTARGPHSNTIDPLPWLAARGLIPPPPPREINYAC
jgi:hypothetical protein